MKKKKYKKILQFYPEEYKELIAHCKQVAKLAVLLFEGTRPLHHLRKKEKKYLLYASLLHDIGYTVDSISHNKHSCKFIMNNSSLPFGKKTRRIVACIARYHRGTSPKETHKIFRKLGSKEQKTVAILSAILRIADGLDYTHQNSIQSVSVQIEDNKMTLTVTPNKQVSPTTDIARAQKKSQLFTHLFSLKEIIFKENRKEGSD